MTEHVYVVTTAGQCNGASVTVYADALSAINAARRIVLNGGPSWEEPDHPMQEPERLYEAFGDGDEEWVVVTQQRVLRAAPTVSVTAPSATSEVGVAADVLRELQWKRRA